jgi:putative membrane protein insertion efficiency factor
MKSAGIWFLLGFLRCYQIFLGPFLGGACKFYPSCSNYAYQAIQQHGARRGTLLAMKRLGRCRPFTKGGYDPVPETTEEGIQQVNPQECFVLRAQRFAPANEKIGQESAR